MSVLTDELLDPFAPALVDDPYATYTRLLDAFGFWRFDLGRLPSELRLGQQVVSWGESTFIQGGLNQVNHFDVSALRVPGAELKFFAPTEPDKPWTSGSFGCVRDYGHRMHEGLDIRHLQTDRRGEPTDPVMATADGTVVYISTRP